jgi:hypothetical protein
MDKNFRKGFDEMIFLTEKGYNISLSLSEKVRLRDYLKYAQETCEFEGGREVISGHHMKEAMYMWLSDYGISYGDAKIFGKIPQFKEYFRRVREECFLI